MRRKNTIPLSLLVLALVMSLSWTVSAQDGELLSLTADSCDYGGAFKSIEAVDALTVKFTLCNPDPAFNYKVASAGLGIFSTEQLESTGGGGPELLDNPIGTGPYKISNWDKGNELVLVRNENYWGEPAGEETLIFRWNAESAARLVELQAGNVDGVDNPAPGDYASVEADSSLQLLSRAGLNVMYMGMNNQYPPFDNVKFRQAIGYAIDKQRLVDNFYTPGSVAATQFLPTIAFGYTPEVEPFPFDQDKARELLAEAAAEEGVDSFEITLSYREAVRSYLPQPGVVAQDIQAQLGEVGINVTLELVENASFLDEAYSGNLEMYLLGWLADYGDATNFLDVHFGGGAPEQFGEKIPELVELLAEGAALADEDARYPIYLEANTLLRDLAPMLPVAHGSSAVVYAARIVNANAHPIGYESFKVLEDPDDDNIVWMQSLEPAALFCLDEIDGTTLRNCQQINDSLLGYELNSAAVVPSLATDFTVNDDLTEWTFNLREGVLFSDGSAFDANDVVLTYIVAWDASNPLHVGREGTFTYFQAFFGSLLNAPE